MYWVILSSTNETSKPWIWEQNWLHDFQGPLLTVKNFKLTTQSKARITHPWSWSWLRKGWHRFLSKCLWWVWARVLALCSGLVRAWYYSYHRTRKEQCTRDREPISNPGLGSNFMSHLTFVSWFSVSLQGFSGFPLCPFHNEGWF